LLLWRFDYGSLLRNCLAGCPLPVKSLPSSLGRDVIALSRQFGENPKLKLCLCR
jgi:hypothetical protein